MSGTAWSGSFVPVPADPGGHGRVGLEQRLGARRLDRLALALAGVDRVAFVAAGVVVVLAAGGGDGVFALAAGEAVVALAAVDDVVAVAADDRVVAGAALKDVVALGPADAVVAAAAVDDEGDVQVLQSGAEDLAVVSCSVTATSLVEIESLPPLPLTTT